MPYLVKMIKLEPFSKAIFRFSQSIKDELKIKFHIPEVIKYSLLYLIIMSGGIAICTIPLKWNNKSVSYFGLRVDTSLQGSQSFVIELLHNFYFIGWLLIAILFLFGLLFPLGNSFLVNQTLWLRLTPCSPYEVAVSRAIWIIIYALFLGLLSFIWAVSCTLLNHIPLNSLLTENSLLIDIQGLVSHVILSGGIVVFLDFNIKNFISRMFISIVAWMIPIILVIIYIPLLITNPEGILTKIFPYTEPISLINSLPNNGKHFFASAVLGCLLLILSVVIKLVTLERSEFTGYLTTVVQKFKKLS